MCEYNECPTCTQDWVANTDYECGCCGRLASEHIRVTSLCRILRETQQREHALLVERDELKLQIEQVREQYRLSSVCRELKEENEKLKRLVTWPHDVDPFTSPDHDNDQNIYQ